MLRLSAIGLYELYDILQLVFHAVEMRWDDGADLQDELPAILAEVYDAQGVDLRYLTGEGHDASANTSRRMRHGHA